VSRVLRAVILALAVLLGPGAALSASTWEDARQVTKEELVAAMRGQQAREYTIEAIANSNRLQTSVFLELAEKASKNDPQRRPLRVGHVEYFDALLEVTGLSRDAAPTYVKVPHVFGQDYLIDYRMENVVERVERGQRPLRALNVKGGWPQAPNAPASYSYEDKSTQPHVEVTHQQVVAYRILDFGNVVVCDEIRGITGRATSGLLGFLFDLIGKAHAVHTRYTVAPDGIQLSRTAASRLLTVTQTVTIYPGGEVLAGVPPDRRDLARLDRALRNLDLEVVYVPLEMSPVPQPAM
jgi:hypothetical protein